MSAAPAPLAGAPLPVASAAPNGAADELRRVAQEFETLFLSEMLAPMFASLETDGLGGGGMGEEIFRPMLVERYAEGIARSGGVGIAESVLAEMLRLQQTVPPAEDDSGAGG